MKRAMRSQPRLNSSLQEEEKKRSQIALLLLSLLFDLSFVWNTVIERDDTRVRHLQLRTKTPRCSDHMTLLLFLTLTVLFLFMPPLSLLSSLHCLLLLLFFLLTVTATCRLEQKPLLLLFGSTLLAFLSFLPL